MSWWDDLRLQQAVSQGQWGFALQGQQLGSLPEQDLMTAELPEGNPVPWTVSLNGWRYSLGTLSAVGGSTGLPLPADNQTAPAAYLYARLTWGTSGRSETALVDYPVMGVSVGLNASSLRVGLQSSAPLAPFGLIPPMLGGMITPAPRNLAQEGVGPTFSREITVSAGPSTAFVARPRRAVAYRVMVSSAVAVGALTFFQTDSSAGINYQRDQAISTAGAGETMADSRALWFPLHPQAQAIRIVNTDIQYVVTVQFLIDLG